MSRLLFPVFFLMVSFGLRAEKTERAPLKADPSMSSEKIIHMLNKARAGDTIFFAPGTYKGPFVLEGLQGSENLPVVIMGSKTTPGSSSLIDGRTEAGISLENFAFLLKDCAWISIEGFAIKNCWTDLIRAENTSYLSVRNCQLYGGKRALFATGRGSHHFLIEQCTWEQEERVWTHAGNYSWDEIHHGVHRHYNGSLFQGSGISGVIVLRDNQVRNTFNAFRLSQINDGKTDLLACTNVEICRNLIINTSDNVLEPEIHARNLHFYHNRMVNGHAFVSITEVAGGEIYIYGNTAVSLPDSEDGWTVFKISSDRTPLSGPLYIFNNSWRVDFDLIGSPRNVWQNNFVRHFNNACFSEASDTFGIYHLGLENQFDYDCSNVPFPVLLSEAGHEKNGLVADPLFVDPYANDFHLQPASPCVDRGKSVEGLISSYKGNAPDIGAYDNGELVDGPPFRYVAPEAEVPYLEMPRITKFKTEPGLLKVWFSLPLDRASAASTQFSLNEDQNRLELVEQSFDGYCLTFSCKSEEAPAISKLLLSCWALGENGRPLTSWASALPVELIK